MSNSIRAHQEWDWVGRFTGVVVVSLVLAAAIGGMDLFEKTFVITGKLSASQLVRFLGYSAALAALWMMGRRATIALQQSGGRWSFLQHLLLPVITLIVVASTNSVALLVLKPLMNPAMHNVYNWVFIVAILSCAAWVLMAVLGQSSPLTEALTSAAESINASSKIRVCDNCSTSNESVAKFCKECAQKLA